jgi:hypothetical protein
VGATQTWVVAYNGDRGRVGSDGNVGIGVSTPAARLDVGGAVRADAFSFAPPVSRTQSIPGAAFRPSGSSLPAIVEGAISGTYLAATIDSGAMIAPLQLPDGANLQPITPCLPDNSASSSLVFRPYRRPNDQFGSSAVATSPSTTTGTTIQAVSMSPGPVIESTANSYYMLVESGDWAGPSTSVYGGRVEYAIAGPG